ERSPARAARGARPGALARDHARGPAARGDTRQSHHRPGAGGRSGNRRARRHCDRQGDVTRELARLTVALVLVLAGAQAHADTRRMEATGEAPSGTGDARVRAIDAALADAVSRALDDMVPADARQRHRKELTDGVVRRA